MTKIAKKEIQDHDSRLINGKKYDVNSYHFGKQEAEMDAKDLREIGYSVRVLQYYITEHGRRKNVYTVYTHWVGKKKK
jgi:hypothetical protein